jgi:hypothetical protein
MPYKNLLKSTQFQMHEGARISRQVERESKPEVQSVNSYNSKTNKLTTTNFEPPRTSNFSYHDPLLFGPAVTAFVDALNEAECHSTLDALTAIDDSCPDKESYGNALEGDEEAETRLRYQVSNHGLTCTDRVLTQCARATVYSSNHSLQLCP